MDIKWHNSTPQKVVIRPTVNNTCIVRSTCALKLAGSTATSKEQGGSYVLQFSARQDTVYELFPL